MTKFLLFFGVLSLFGIGRSGTITIEAKDCGANGCLQTISEFTCKGNRLKAVISGRSDGFNKPAEHVPSQKKYCGCPPEVMQTVKDYIQKAAAGESGKADIEGMNIVYRSQSPGNYTVNITY